MPGGGSRYDALLDIFEPDMTSARLDSLFADLKSWLPSLLSRGGGEAGEADANRPAGALSPLLNNGSWACRRCVSLALTSTAGASTSAPTRSAAAYPEDVRITTRYNENDLLSALFGVIHETGHARYEQNLPRPWVDQPVGLARSTAIHESQSLFLKCSWDAASGFLTACYRRCASGLAIGRPLAEDNFVASESAGETRLYSRRCR